MFWSSSGRESRPQSLLPSFWSWTKKQKKAKRQCLFANFPWSSKWEFLLPGYYRRLPTPFW
jgi:hypothetical protein